MSWNPAYALNALISGLQSLLTKNNAVVSYSSGEETHGRVACNDIPSHPSHPQQQTLFSYNTLTTP